MEVRIADTEDQWRRCFPVIAQLRPHLSEEEFLARVRRQQARFGYRLAYVEEGAQVQAVAGFRFSKSLCDGPYLYVDDLVTDLDHRSQGFGHFLFDWLLATARSEGCSVVGLESGVQRHDAHRFYLRKRMRIGSYHFSLRLD
jgi:GNAT superfamily N-acetyltransferase